MHTAQFTVAREVQKFLFHVFSTLTLPPARGMPDNGQRLLINRLTGDARLEFIRNGPAPTTKSIAYKLSRYCSFSSFPGG